LARALRARLFDDEEVVVVVRPSRLARLPRYVVTLGLYGLWRKRDETVLTDQRILLGKGIVRRHERSIPLERVNDVAVARRAVYSFSDLTIDEHGRPSVRRIGPMTQGSARRFSKEILRRG
jgi:hypothetical protein